MKKIFTILLTLTMLITLCISASAVTHAQYGLEAQITPSVSADSISFGITVENISNQDIKGVYVEASLPEGLSPASETKKDIGTLSAYEKTDFAINTSLSQVPFTLNLNGQSYGISVSSLIISAIVLVAILILFIFVFKNKYFRKTFVIFLCILIAIPSIGFIPTFAKNADESFTVSETVNLNGTDYTVNFTFGLAEQDIETSLSCENDTTVENATQDIKGCVVSDEKIVSVDYKVYSEIDKGAVSFEGKASVNGGHYLITDTILKPDGNEIILTATTESGKKIEETVNIHYDSSSIYEHSDSDISVDKASGKRYINNIINVLFNSDTSDSQKQSLIKELNAEKVGYINGSNMWQLKITASTLDELNDICADLNKKAFISSAYVDFVDFTANVTPSDPWGGSSWSEASPSGNNWSVEMVQALSAWDYDNYFNDINIGFVDSGCDYDHEDLNGRILFTSTENEAGCDEQNHGTHVAGIMGAIPNNNKGGTGILWNGKIYAHDANPNNGSSMTTTSCYNGIVQNVEAGAKVVNLSVGLSTITTLTANDISNFSTGASSYIAYLLNSGYDFIICQSSGNGNSSGTAVNTNMNGMFCCIEQSNTGQSAAMSKKIADRVMIVGSMSSGGSQSTSSNYGENVDLAAPGVSVYSSIIGGYGIMSGTSMSSPLVAAMLGVVWSVNPDLTGGEVADIVKTTASEYRSAYASVTNQTALPVPNLLTAVEAAINTLPALDFTELDNAISLFPSDLSYYASDSVTALREAYNSATTLDRENASQNQINEITQNLFDAIFSAKIALTSPATISIPDTITIGSSAASQISFSCVGASDIKISFSNDNVVYSAQSGTTANAVISVSGKKLTSSDIGTVACTVTYTYEGVTHTLNRYIEVVDTVYAAQPLVDTSITRSGGNWLSGYNPSLFNIATITGTSKAKNPSANTSNGYFDYNANAFVRDSNTAIGTQWGGYQLSGTSASNLMEESYAPKGYLYVDKSSYSQLSEVPNLALYIYQYKKCTKASEGTKVLSITTSNNNYSVNVEATELGTSANSVGGSQTYKINGPVPDKTTTVRFYIRTQATANGATSDPTTVAGVFLDLVIVPQDKSDLESLLDKLYVANHQSLFYTEKTFSDYSDAFKTAASVYANPYSEQNEIDEAYKKLMTAFFNLKFAESADYSELDSLISQAEKINHNMYTDYSLESFEKAYKAVYTINRTYFKAYQNYIDSMAQALQSGISELLLCGDLNADGVVDGNDAFIMSCIISKTLTQTDLGKYKYSAADADKNGSINHIDYNIIYNHGLTP